MRQDVRLAGCLVFSILSLAVVAGCAREESPAPADTAGERPAEGVAPDQPQATTQPARSVEGLRVPLPGETFTIDGETWEVVASEIAVSHEDLPQDTRILDVTVSARRAAVEPLDYLGQDEEQQEPGP